MRHHPVSVTSSFPFASYRRLRHGTRRPSCPHCHAVRVHRWGSFSGRLRYRCTACRRTFSDFTGTPLANLKHIDRWPGFAHCVLASLTVRQTAELLGVDKTTAFRWRHRLLHALNESDTRFLGPTVLIHETSFPYSEKGTRDLDRPPRRRTVFGRLDVPTAWVCVARDPGHRFASGVVGLRRPDAVALQTLLGPRLHPTAELVSIFGPYGAAGLLAVRTDRRYRRLSRQTPEFRAVQRSVLALRSWLRRFNGVATRYLDNYLAWHRYLEAAARGILPNPHQVPDPPHGWLLAGKFP